VGLLQQGFSQISWQDNNVRPWRWRSFQSDTWYTHDL